MHPTEIQARSAAFELFGHAKLGDARRTKRLVQITEGVLSHPGGMISGVFATAAARCGAYDFIENQQVDPGAILEAAVIATADKARLYSFVWIVTDGCSAAVSDTQLKKGTGRLGSVRNGARGDQMHTCLVLDPSGIPLGIGGLQSWQRPQKSTRSERLRKDVKDKETQRWLDGRGFARDLFQERCPEVQRVFVHDRGADNWPVLLDMVQQQDCEHSIVRSCWDRRLWEQEELALEDRKYLRAEVRTTVPIDAMELTLSATTAGPERTIVAEIRARKVTLRLRDKWSNQSTPLPIHVVCVRERNAEKKPVEWILLTTLPIDTVEQVKRVIEGYQYRWRIELFHRAFKSAGTEMESSQLGSADNRYRWNIILAATSCLLLRWQLLALQKPATPASEEFSAQEIEAITEYQSDFELPTNRALTMWDVIMMLASLGGWPKGRRPGVLVICRGWQRVYAYLQGKRQTEKNQRRRLAGSRDPG